MAKMNNEQIIKAVSQELTSDIAEQIEGKSSVELLAVFDDFPNVKNAFINTLTNKVAKSVIFSKIFITSSSYIYFFNLEIKIL